LNRNGEDGRGDEPTCDEPDNRRADEPILDEKWKGKDAFGIATIRNGNAMFRKGFE
jgi:hypothetical protein